MRAASPMHGRPAEVGPQATTSSLNLDDSISVNGGLTATVGDGLGVPMPKADPHELQHIRGVVLLNAAKLRTATWQVGPHITLHFTRLVSLRVSHT